MPKYTLLDLSTAVGRQLLREYHDLLGRFERERDFQLKELEKEVKKSKREVDSEFRGELLEIGRIRAEGSRFPIWRRLREMHKVMSSPDDRARRGKIQSQHDSMLRRGERKIIKEYEKKSQDNYLKYSELVRKDLLRRVAC